MSNDITLICFSGYGCGYGYGNLVTGLWMTFSSIEVENTAQLGVQETFVHYFVIVVRSCVASLVHSAKNHRAQYTS